MSPAPKRVYKRKAKKAPARKTPAKRGSKAGARKPRARRSSPIKEVIRQQTLGQQTRSFCNMRAGKPDSRAKMMKAVGTPQNFITNSSDRISTEGIAGRQCWNDSRIADTLDLKSIGTYLAQNNAQNANTAPARYLLENVKHRVSFSNAGQANTKLTIYHCTARRDLYTSMNYVSPNSTVYPWVGDAPINAVQQGISAASGGVTVGSTAYFIPGMLPYESQIFNTHFRVHKETEVMLAIGGSHTLETNKSFNKVVDATVYGNNLQAAMFGITEFLLYRVEGQTGVEDDASVTVAQSQVVYVESWDYRFTQLQTAPKNLNYIDIVEADENPVYVISASTGSSVEATGTIS